MASLNARQIGELVAELDPLLRGARLRDLVALPPRDLLLVFEPADAAAGGVLRLRLSVDADHPRIHLQHGRVDRPKGPPGPFYRELAADLSGATLRSLEQVRGDRIALLEFRDASPGARRALLCELFGRHANLVLLGPDDRVLALLVPPPSRQGAPRLTPGAPWRPPPGAAPATAALPSVCESFPVPPPAGARAPLSGRVEAALGGEVEERDEERARRELLRRLARRLSRARASLAGLERRLEATAGAERLRQDGELLQASLGELRRGMEACELADWYSEGTPPRRIELDPRRSPLENAVACFERARRLEEAARELPAEIARARVRVAGLEKLEARAKDASSDPGEIEEEARAAGLLDERQEGDPRKKKPPPPRLPYRSFRASSGAEIRVGRNARDNDDLTFRHARGNDLWLHTADVPGSHVVLRLEKGVEPAQEDLLDAAHLAVHFSPQRGARRAGVHVARRKEVHKPRGAPPGLVSLSGGRHLDLRLEPERLQRLLGPDRPPGPPEVAGS